MNTIQAKVLIVAPPSIRLWILKLDLDRVFFGSEEDVAPPSIRLWILKQWDADEMVLSLVRCTPFDPLVDTETVVQKGVTMYEQMLHPLRSACGY